MAESLGRMAMRILRRAGRNGGVDGGRIAPQPETLVTSPDEDFDELYRACTAAGGGDRILETLERWYFNPAQQVLKD